MPDLTGRSLGRYHILEQLGEGGMATVYKAYDTRLERDVAVKVIRRGAFPPDQLERILKRFEREAKALGRLTHPNIVPVIDYGEHEGAPYLVMPFLPGGTLKQRMGKPIRWQEAAHLLIPVARALDFAHRQGMAHRDVKPANILITADGDPLLTDFGIAKLLEVEEGNTLTGTGVGIGTPEYMAPEQWTGNATAQSDIYSLGIVLYECVTGRKPYTADTPAAVLVKQTSEPLPRPTEYVPDLPEQVEKVLLKALAKKPEDRFEDMATFASALEKLLQVAQIEEKVEKPPRKQVERTTAPAVNTMATVEQAVTGETVLQDEERKMVQKRSGDWNLPAPSPVKKMTWLPWTLVGSGMAVLFLIVVIIVVIVFFTNQNELATLSASPTVKPESTPIISTATFTLSSPIHLVATPSTLLTVSTTRTRSEDDMVMVFVPAGEFEMGSVGKEPDEYPIHSVYLDDFWIDQTEITNAMYSSCVQWGECNPPTSYSSYSRSGYFSNEAYFGYPVIWVSWYDAMAYCSWVGARLPSEEEWEKAARGTDGWLYPWGYNEASCSWANIGGAEGCVGDTSEVGKYPSGASLYGALDLAGNVWEWVDDWYDAYPGGDTGVSDDYGTSMRVLRGGSWAADAEHARSAFRNWGDPALGSRAIGFRCVQSAP